MMHRGSAQELFPKDFARQQPSQGQPSAGRAEQDSASTPTHIFKSSNAEVLLGGVVPKVERIVGAVYINSSDKQHLELVISKVLELQRQPKFQIVSVIHIGDYRNVEAKWHRDLLAAGIALSAIDKLPEDLLLTRSPAWSFITPESQIQRQTYIIQGILQPEVFFNITGRFELPIGVQISGDEEKIASLAKF